MASTAARSWPRARPAKSPALSSAAACPIITLGVFITTAFSTMGVPNTFLIGPDGQVIPAPGGWNDPLVKGVIDRYAVVRVLV